ncbi:MAG: PD-(D/E)XK nuclease family protein, partial [Eggerthellaceae bacterium]|nr:PD-(D/E)XK nuclease family protein [Eggerthellaceae bacterium]
VRRLRDGDAPDTWSPKLQLAVRVMGSLVGGSGRSLVSRVIMRAVVDSGWLTRLQARGAEGLASAANVYKAIRMVEGIERTQASGPSRTAALFEVLLEEAKEAPGALSATGGDFVRIMTVHASKGLEFPIVAVGEFKSTAGSSSRLLVNEVEGDIMLSLDLQNAVAVLGGSANLSALPALYSSMIADAVDENELLQAARNAQGALELRAALHEYDRMGDEEESKRLLYVALTRAKEALVVSLVGARTKDNPLGTPKGCLGALVPALAGEGEGAGFDVGVSHFEYGGSAPALVEHVALEAVTGADAAEGPDAAGDEDAAGKAASSVVTSPEAMFAVPAEEPHLSVSRVPYAPAHEGVFSYSSVAEASHEGDLLECLARQFCVSVDAAEQGGLSADLSVVDNLLDEVTSELDFTPDVASLNRNAAVVDEDDGSWAYTGSSHADSDKATDLGTAFHRLAQYAVVARDDSGALVHPPQMRVDALANAGNLDGVQRARLESALDRWFESDLAARMAGFDDLRAEAPFFVDLPAEGGRRVFLEGEIDLLALDDSCAVVVDYKTGGHTDEDEETLSRKHVLQASCYAYAIMRQGIREVEAIFARVERPRPDGQPQCVHYRFTASDLPVLEKAISGAYAKSQGLE